MTGPGPTGAEVEAILAIAARVPDHGKLAPWRFILFDGEGRRRAGDVIASVFEAENPGAPGARVEVERTRLLHAPLVIGVVSRAGHHVKIPEWEQLLSAGAAPQYMDVAGHPRGFGAGGEPGWFSYDERVAQGLGLAGAERFVGFVHIGRPTVVVEDRVRPVMADLVTAF